MECLNVQAYLNLSCCNVLIGTFKCNSKHVSSTETETNCQLPVLAIFFKHLYLQMVSHIAYTRIKMQMSFTNESLLS